MRQNNAKTMCERWEMTRPLGRVTLIFIRIVKSIVAAVFVLGLFFPAVSPLHAEIVQVKYRGPVDLTPFACTNISRSSFIKSVCYDKRNEYMLISLSGTYYHYCEIDADTVSSLLDAPSMGRFYNASIKGRFDCRTHRVPSYGDGERHHETTNGDAVKAQ
jgi:KTSC domain